jgi:ABC-2 type transport system permease protein
MPKPAESAAGNIYDLGYRNYEGVRLGRRYAVLSLYIQSLRGIFGFGRHTSSKIIPIGLTIIAFLPAVIQLGVTAITPDAIEPSGMFQPSDYYEFIQWPLVLFVAAVGPELLGRDQRNHTLSLYFSRALLRSDYVLAKLAALASALIIISLVPQLLVFAGNAFAGSDSLQYVRDNWRDIAPIVGSGILLSLFMSSIALAIASQTSRWQLASGGVIAYFGITWVLGSILVYSFPNGPAGYSLLFSGFHVARGITLWLFGITPMLSVDGSSGGLTTDLVNADISLFLYAIAAGVTIAITLAITYRRYRRLTL